MASSPSAGQRLRRSQLFSRKPLAMLLEEAKGENRLRRVLGPVQLTALGVGVFALVSLRPRRLVPFCLAALAGLVPTLVFNAMLFGNPLTPPNVAGAFQDTFPRFGWDNLAQKLDFYFLSGKTGILAFSPGMRALAESRSIPRGKTTKRGASGNNNGKSIVLTTTFAWLFSFRKIMEQAKVFEAGRRTSTAATEAIIF